MKKKSYFGDFTNEFSVPISHFTYCLTMSYLVPNQNVIRNITIFLFKVFCLEDLLSGLTPMSSVSSLSLQPCFSRKTSPVVPGRIIY